MTDLPLLRFIPYRRSDIMQMCLGAAVLDDRRQEQFERGAVLIEEHFQRDFHRVKQRLKEAYAPLDPDADTRVVEELREPGASDSLLGILAEILDRANYERVSEEALQRALASSSLFQVRLYVDLDDFAEVLLYTRGPGKRRETLKEFFGLWRREVTFTNYERVLLYIRFKDDLDSDSALGECQPGSTMLKLFQNVPEADVEMLFPNIRVGMRLLDKLMIGVPAVVSGGLVFTTKMGATMLLIGSLLGFWLGVSSEPVELDQRALLVLVAGLSALGGYLWKQYSNFRNRKLKYTQALTENLYFKLLDNNAGALFRLLDDAEESECKESLIAYCFLLAEDVPVSAEHLDRRIEAWFAQRWQCRLDFEIEDALGKLLRLELASREGEQWRALPAPGPAA